YVERPTSVRLLPPLPPWSSELPPPRFRVEIRCVPSGGPRERRRRELAAAPAGAVARDLRDAPHDVPGRGKGEPREGAPREPLVGDHAPPDTARALDRATPPRRPHLRHRPRLHHPRGAGRDERRGGAAAGARGPVGRT